MKQLIAITILSILVNILCLWDYINTQKIFKHMKTESNEIYISLISDTPITDEDLSNKIINLKSYWTEKMDVLVVSVNRKDLQVISDHLQFLDASITNDDQETAVTYSLLLKYNIEGLHEISGINLVNIL